MNKPDVPKDWQSILLGDETHLEIISGGTPPSRKKEYWGGSVLWATPTDITSLKGNSIRITEKTITEEGLRNSSARLLPRGSVLMTTRATIGEVAINEEPMATNQGFQNFICREGIYNHYLLYSLQYHKNSLSRLGGQSTFKEVPRSMLKKYNIPLPPLSEQKKIAEVLSTVDNAIQRADEVINGTERLKQGLMQKLLTEGIGHTEFIDSPVGEIPKKWDVVQLKDISLRTHLTDPRKAKDKEFQYVDISSIDNIAFSIVSWNTITGQNAPSRARKVIQTGDILFATTRPYLKNIAIVPSSLNGEVCSTGFCVIRANTSETTTEWIYHNVLTPQFLTKIKVKMKGATYPAVSDKDVMNVTIAKPMLEEQKRISEILSTVDRKSDLERERKSRLERIKLGLMNDLLTGRKRVNVGG